MKKAKNQTKKTPFIVSAGTGSASMDAEEPLEDPFIPLCLDTSHGPLDPPPPALQSVFDTPPVVRGDTNPPLLSPHGSLSTIKANSPRSTQRRYKISPNKRKTEYKRQNLNKIYVNKKKARDKIETQDAVNMKETCDINENEISVNRKRIWDHSQNEHGQIGIIVSVCLRNFMCHDNLSFDFDPHINLITGQNGSGKSAILNGIILALGGRSSSTGRHTNIKRYIKTGRHSATLSVTLKNCGPEAYKAQEYGSKITVERVLYSTGDSNYKLKSQGGKIISTSQEELKNILTVMDIQIENPIVVLTQGNSRNLLISKKSKGHDLYQMFYRGTGLSRVEEDYNRAVQQKDEAESEVKHKKSVLPEIRKEIDLLKMYLQKPAELRREYSWAIVIKFEKDRDALKADFEKSKKEYEALRYNLELNQSERNKVIKKLADLKTSKRNSMDKMTILRKKLQILTPRHAEIISDIREIKGTHTRFEQEIIKLTNETTNQQEMIDEEKLKDQNTVKEDQLRKESTIKVMKRQVIQVSQKLKHLDELKDTVFLSMADMNARKEELRTEIQEKKNELDNILRKKEKMMAGMKDRIEVFGPEMKPLIRDIEMATKNGMFKLQPKGPIGLYLNVKDVKWTMAIQHCLKASLLKSFCCDNHLDAAQLRKIMDKYYTNFQKRPSIITAKYTSEMFNVDRYKTKVKDYPTVLDVLEIKDPVIANCLIDQRQIENILLIPGFDDARDLMMHNPPKYCRSAYTLNCYEFLHTPYRSYKNKDGNQICMLKYVNQEDILKVNEEYSIVYAEWDIKIAAKRVLKQDWDRAVENKEKIDSQLATLMNMLRGLQMRIKDQESTLEKILTKDFNYLQNHLEQFQAEILKNEEILSEVKVDLKSKEQELTSYEDEIAELKRQLEIETNNCQDRASEIDEGENKKESLDSIIAKTEAKLELLESALNELEINLKNVIAATEVSKKNAEVSPRIETERSVREIRLELQATEKAKEQSNYDQETLLAEFQEKVEKYKLSKAELHRLDLINQAIAQMMTQRFAKFQAICKATSLSLTADFTQLLKQNRFSGYPIINLKEQTLAIHVKPIGRSSELREKEIVATEKQNLAGLSGGERSYITTAFLLALWEGIETPFRILDEFDVFMDCNNRRKSILLLLRMAKLKKNTQYIFLSPLELPLIPGYDDVKVHKMPDPKR